MKSKGFVCLVMALMATLVHHAEDECAECPMVDLNTLALPGCGLQLADSRLINDRGKIVCSLVLPSGDLHAVLLIPVDDDEKASLVNMAISPLSPLYVPRERQRPTRPQWSKQ